MYVSHAKLERNTTQISVHCTHRQMPLEYLQFQQTRQAILLESMFEVV